MLTLGMLYNNKKIQKRLKSYSKTTDINWKDVYTVSILVQNNEPVKIILGNGGFKNVKEIPFDEVFPEGWEKGLKG